MTCQVTFRIIYKNSMASFVRNAFLDHDGIILHQTSASTFVRVSNLAQNQKLTTNLLLGILLIHVAKVIRVGVIPNQAKSDRYGQQIRKHSF